MREMVAVIDFGSQYNQLIARRVRQLGVYCKIVPPETRWDETSTRSPKAIILSGGPASVLDPDAAGLDRSLAGVGRERLSTPVVGRDQPATPTFARVRTATV